MKPKEEEEFLPMPPRGYYYKLIYKKTIRGRLIWDHKLVRIKDHKP